MGYILEISKKTLNDCSAQVGKYCVEMDKPVSDMAIQRNSPMSRHAVGALKLEDCSVAKSHIARNISDLDVRLTYHQESQATEMQIPIIYWGVISRIYGY